VLFIISRRCPEETHLNRWAKRQLIIKIARGTNLSAWFETWWQTLRNNNMSSKKNGSCSVCFEANFHKRRRSHSGQGCEHVRHVIWEKWCKCCRRSEGNFFSKTICCLIRFHQCVGTYLLQVRNIAKLWKQSIAGRFLESSTANLDRSISIFFVVVGIRLWYLAWFCFRFAAY